MYHSGGQGVRDACPNLLTLDGDWIGVTRLIWISVRYEPVNSPQISFAKTHHVVFVDRLQRCTNILFREHLRINDEYNIKAID